jgi:pheromone shutdown protein TraB
MSMITLVGVGHVFDLKNQVRNIILSKRPQVVCIELDRGRFEAMLEKGHTEDAPFSYRLLSLMQRFIARKYDVQLGEEMLTAARVSKEVGARLAFIDMDASVFYQRVTATMSFEEKMKMLAGALTGMFVRKKRIEKELKNYEKNEAEYLEAFEKEFPSIKKVLVDERNEYMARAIREVHNDYSSIVAVIGDGHIEGISRLIGDLEPEIIRLKELREGDFKVEVHEGRESTGENVSYGYSFEVEK